MLPENKDEPVNRSYQCLEELVGVEKAIEINAFVCRSVKDALKYGNHKIIDCRCFYDFGNILLQFRYDNGFRADAKWLEYQLYSQDLGFKLKSSLRYIIGIVYLILGLGVDFSFPSCDNEKGAWF
jgi:hypothetical protein